MRLPVPLRREEAEVEEGYLDRRTGVRLSSCYVLAKFWPSGESILGSLDYRKSATLATIFAQSLPDFDLFPLLLLPALLYPGHTAATIFFPRQIALEDSR